MKLIANTMVFISLCLIVSSCGVTNQGEKEQGGANKMIVSDLSGNYQLEADSDFTEISLQINNEGSFSNILGIIDRNDFTKEEKQAFAKRNIPLHKVEKFKSHFEIGVGEYRDILGRENVLEEARNGSRLYIQTDDNESLKLEKDTVKYTLHAKKKKDSNVLKGVLTLIITDSPNEIFDVNATIIEIPFNNNLDVSFPVLEYHGTWSGSFVVEQEHRELLRTLRHISITQVDPQSFTVSSAQSTFTVKKENFQMIVSKIKMKELSRREFPTITLEFAGNMGSIVSITGKINSLEKFQGSISLSDVNGIITQIGLFTFKKNN